MKPWHNRGCYGGGCHVHAPRPYYRPTYALPAYAPPAYVAAPACVAAPAPQTYVAPAAPATNCLRKEYTQDNQLVMRDVCTNEVLTGPAGVPAQQSALQPPPQEQPVQQGQPVQADEPQQAPQQ